MTISYNSHVNPARVIVSSHDADEVDLVIPAGGTNVAWPVWKRLDMIAPSSMSQVKLLGTNAEIYLNSLSLQSVERIYYSTGGYYEVATYKASNSSYNYKWTQYEFAGYVYRDGTTNMADNPKGSGGSVTVTGIPSTLDYDNMTIDIDTVPTVNLDFKSDITTGHGTPTYSPSTFPTLRINMKVASSYYPSSGNLAVSWKAVGNWVSSTSYTYSYNGVYAYVAYSGSIFQTNSNVTVQFVKYHRS